MMLTITVNTLVDEYDESNSDGNMSLAATTALATVQQAQLTSQTLTNAPGDGSLTVTVDGTGLFGSNGSSDTSDAEFDPVGELDEGGTTYFSGVAIRYGGKTLFLNDATASAPTFSSGHAGLFSEFTIGPLHFHLTQTLEELFSGNLHVGSRLIQKYEIINTSSTDVAFELFRYLDGDLTWVGSLRDGGGRQFAHGIETLYEIDTVSGDRANATYIGITAEGGSTTGPGRYEVEDYDDLKNRISDDENLRQTIRGDTDGDQLIDDQQADIALALRNVFSLAAGESEAYTTTTIFGTGEPEVDEVIPVVTLPPEPPEKPELDPPLIPDPLPEPSLLLVIKPVVSAPTMRADYGTGGEVAQVRSMDFSVASAASAAVDNYLASGEVNDAPLFASFLDFVDPEALIIDLGDEPPAKLAIDETKAAASENPSGPNRMQEAVDAAHAVTYFKPQVDTEASPGEAVPIPARPSNSFASNGKWLATAATILLVGGIGWRRRATRIQAARTFEVPDHV